MALAFKWYGTKESVIDSVLDRGAMLVAAASTAKFLAKYIPLRHGKLRQNRTIEPGKVTYNSSYAAAQYERQYRQYTTSGTGPDWDQKVQRNDVGKIAQEITNYLRSRG